MQLRPSSDEELILHQRYCEDTDTYDLRKIRQASAYWATIAGLNFPKGPIPARKT